MMRMEHAVDLAAINQHSTPYSGRRVLVTGASGFVGRWLAARLSELGADVHGLGRNLSRMPQGIRGWAVDLRHYDAVRSAVNAIRPELVFHLAAFVTARQDRGLVRPMLEHTLMSTVHLLSAVADVSCQRVVLLSSAEAIGSGPPKSPYAAAKASAEFFAALFQHTYSLPTVILRPTLVYGAGQPHDKLIPYIITSLVRGSEPALHQPDRICDLLYVRDLVDALCLAAKQPGIEGQTIDIGSGIKVSIAELSQKIAALLGKSSSISADSTRRSVGSTDLIVETERAFRLLAWRARWTLHEGLSATLPAYTPSIQRREVA